MPSEKKRKKFRLFSFKRMALSVLLGFFIPFGYAFLLSEVSDYTKIIPPDFMIMTFGWPRPLWIILMGRDPTEADIIPGIIFMAVCNTVVYGAAVYVFLSLFSLARKSRVRDLPLPPNNDLASE